jgi:hypothetical protein
MRQHIKFCKKLLIMIFQMIFLMITIPALPRRIITPEGVVAGEVEVLDAILGGVDEKIVPQSGLKLQV